MEVRLRSLAGQWRIERVTVDPVRPFEPEALPVTRPRSAPSSAE